MTSPAPETPDHQAAPSFSIHAHSRATRAVTAGLLAVSALNVLYLGAALLGDFFNGTETAPPIPVAAGLILFSGLPRAIASLLNRLVQDKLSLETDNLVLQLGAERVEIPITSIVEIRPLRVPMPMSGVAIELRSGRIFEQTLGSRDLGPLFAALSERLPHKGGPMLDHAASLPKKRSRALFIAKHLVLPLSLTLVIFRLHQIIVFGGPFGQYHSMGIWPYLASFFTRWIGIAGAFLVMAGVLRTVTELAVWSLTLARPTSARPSRRVAEIASLLLYFGAIPGYVAFRLLLD